MVCEYACEKDREKGLFDDQIYLNILPVYFENVGIIRHRGCNVANWNQVECRRTIQNDGTVLINGLYPVIFIHFTASTIKGILNGSDSALISYLKIYAKAIKAQSLNIDILSTFCNDVKTGNCAKRFLNLSLSQIKTKAIKKLKLLWD